MPRKCPESVMFSALGDATFLACILLSTRRSCQMERRQHPQPVPYRVAVPRRGPQAEIGERRWWCVGAVRGQDTHQGGHYGLSWHPAMGVCHQGRYALSCASSSEPYVLLAAPSVAATVR